MKYAQSPRWQTRALDKATRDNLLMKRREHFSRIIKQKAKADKQRLKACLCSTNFADPLGVGTSVGGGAADYNVVQQIE